MKKIYESFTEIADDFTNGDHWTHALSDHTSDECYPWQHGVDEFAKFLDTCGVKIISNPDIHETLWSDFKHFKPLKYKECAAIKGKRLKKAANSRKPKRVSSK
jgi:hypothetical protein